MAKNVVRDIARGRLPSTPDSLTSTATAVLDSPPGSARKAASALQSGFAASAAEEPGHAKKRRVLAGTAAAKRIAALGHDEHVTNHHAELFYLQKQIQQQTQMIFVLEGGQRVQGVVEWYDRHSIKVRGKSRVLIYKAAIKYLYKFGENGTAAEK